MTDKAAEQLRSSGWTIVDTTGFISLAFMAAGCR